MYDTPVIICTSRFNIKTFRILSKQNITCCVPHTAANKTATISLNSNNHLVLTMVMGVQDLEVYSEAALCRVNTVATDVSG